MKNLCKFVCVLGMFLSSFAFGQNIGEMHNAVLKEYNKNFSLKGISDIKEMNQRLLSINKELYPEVFTKVTKDDMDRFTLLLYGTKNASDFTYRNQMQVLLDNAVTESKVSENFKTLVIKLIDDNKDVETSLTYVNKFLEGRAVSDFERELLLNFKDVLNASNDFWNNYESGAATQSTSRCNPKHQVRLADAYGTIMGGLLGSAIAPGIGSIFGGALGSQGMSALVESMQDDRGGRCL